MSTFDSVDVLLVKQLHAVCHSSVTADLIRLTYKLYKYMYVMSQDGLGTYCMSVSVALRYYGDNALA